MESTNSEIIHDFSPFFKVYKDGRVEKTQWPPVKIQPSDEPTTGVRSKDVTISDEPQVSARIFLPSIPDPAHKVPLLLYVHGGGFSLGSAFSPQYDSHCKRLAAEARAVVVSVEYRLAPENPIPACYDDSWAALQWVACHASGDGPERWLNDHADLSRVFVGGDSAGGNISHTLAFRVGSIGLPGARLVGAFMVHPYFGGVEADDRMWMYNCPTNTGINDPRMKPSVEDLAVLGCERVLVFVAEKDHLIEAGKGYFERLQKSGWRGRSELVENVGQRHCFHVYDPTNEDAGRLIKKIVSFIHQDLVGAHFMS